MKSNTFSLRSCAAAGILVSVFAAPVASADELFRPYAGVGAQILNLNLQKDYGQKLLKGTIPGSTVFIGTRVGEFTGMELGYNYFSQKRDRILGAQDIYPGSGGQDVLTFFGAHFVQFRTQTRIKDFNLGLTGYLPLEQMGCLFNKTEMFATLGFSRTLVRVRAAIVADDAGSIENPLNHTYKQKKTIPFARIGLQQNLTDSINVGLFSEWKRLSSFKMKSPTNQFVEFRLKDSLSYGLRLGYIFK